MDEILDVRYYLKMPPLQALYAIANDQALIQIEPSQAQLLEFTPLGNKRVKFVVDLHRSTTNQNILPPIEPQTFFYNRLLLTDVFKDNYVFEDLPLPFSTLDILERLSVMEDVVFDKDDIEQKTFTQYPTTAIVLQAKPGSYRFEGSLQIQVVNGSRMDLALFDGVEVPSEYSLPNPSSDKAQGYYYLNPFDFSVNRDDLRSLVMGVDNPLDGIRLAGILTRISGEQWTCSMTPSERNIAYSEKNGTVQYNIRYNGAATEHYTARSDKSRVIILELSETLCTGVIGAIRLHYD